MKNLSILILFTCINVFAQTSEITPEGIAQDMDTIQTPIMKAYNDFVNYTPKSLRGLPKPEKFRQLNLDGMMSLKTSFEFQESLNLKNDELNWIKERISGLAVAFYREGNPVLLRSTGGYNGCPESEYELKKETLNHKVVTIINFCHGCKGSSEHENEFIKIFNSRSKRLLESAK